MFNLAGIFRTSRMGDSISSNFESWNFKYVKQKNRRDLWASSVVAQMVKNSPIMQETRV